LFFVSTARPSGHLNAGSWIGENDASSEVGVDQGDTAIELADQGREPRTDKSGATDAGVRHPRPPVAVDLDRERMVEDPTAGRERLRRVSAGAATTSSCPGSLSGA
jgi:hypothetical protein